ncbi:MAG: hypothetical protein Kow0092_17970 [Deferrisomatales bacterium]
MSATGDESVERWLDRVRSEYWERLDRSQDRGEAVGEQYVVFLLAGRRFAVEAAASKGVVRAPKITRLPGVPDHILGVAGIRGEVVSVTDPARVLGVPGERSPGGGYLLVLASGELKSALRVDRVATVEEIAGEALVPLESAWPGAPEGVLRGQAPGEAGPVFVLDAGAYLQASGPGRRP